MTTPPASVHAAAWVEKGSAHGDDERDDDADGGDGIRNDVPSVAGTEPARLVASGTPGQEPEEVIVVAHGGNYTKSEGTKGSDPSVYVLLYMLG